MNRLQKRAWLELAGAVIAVIIAGAGIAIMVHLNVKGIIGIIPFTFGFLIAGLISFVINIRTYNQLDEREKNIYNRAFMIAAGAFIFCTCFVSFFVFLITGGKNYIPSYIPPLIFLAGLFLSQFVQSTAIIIQFALEQSDEQ